MSKKIQSIADLTPDPHNANKGTERGLAAVEDSLRKYGAGRSIVTDKNGVVIGGNKTLESAADAGIGIQVVRTKGDKLVVVQREDLDLITDERARKLAYADNRAGELGLDWDVDQISSDIDAGLDLGDMFSEKELDAIGVEFPEPDEAPEAQMDAAEELQEKWGVKDGDIWQIGEHRLMCGDCVSVNISKEKTMRDIEHLMSGAVAEMIHTDPPYNIGYGNTKNPRHKIREIENDNLNDAYWEKFCMSLFSVFKTYASGDIYMWGTAAPNGMRMRLWLVETGANWSATIVWKKQQLVLSPSKYQRMYEPCFYGWFDKSSFVADRKQTEVWEVDRPRNSKLHPTMKPIELCERAIKNSSERGAVVLDTFLGSGSTMVAAERLGRKCYGMEIEPKYCAVILERMSEMGLEPELIENAREKTE